MGNFHAISALLHAGAQVNKLDAIRTNIFAGVTCLQLIGTRRFSTLTTTHISAGWDPRTQELLVMTLPRGILSIRDDNIWLNVSVNKSDSTSID
jgi:hypothetical protein